MVVALGTSFLGGSGGIAGTSTTPGVMPSGELLPMSYDDSLELLEDA